MSEFAFDWSELAFGSKKPLRSLHATFIAASRHMSKPRFSQLVKEQLPLGNIVLGISKDAFVVGFEDQSQFRMLALKDVEEIIDKVNNSSSRHKIYTLDYFQRELPFLLEKLEFNKALFINGSWKYTFHTRPEFYQLVKQKTPYELISPFSSEDEARQYAVDFDETFPNEKKLYSAKEMLELARGVATRSFDYSFQTGVVLAKKVGNKYELIEYAFNKVVPYQAYAMHHGASREIHFSPPNDLNHYDAVHAEVALMMKVAKEKIDLKSTVLFINLLPCPSCARMFTQTDINEFIYEQDHSDGYAVKLLQLAGKKVTRVI